MFNENESDSEPALGNFSSSCRMLTSNYSKLVLVCANSSLYFGCWGRRSNAAVPLTFSRINRSALLSRSHPFMAGLCFF